jgi:hypothetical protein
MDRTLLFSMNTDQIRVTVEAFFDNAGSLVVEGYDIGKTVEEYWGDSDYEYSVTISAAEVEKLYAALQLPPNRETLLAYLQKHYHENDCYSKISELLDTHGIRYEGFSWR